MGFGEMAITEEKLRELDAHGWELYHVAEDFSETKNLAAQNRDKLDRDDRDSGTSRRASTTCCRSTAAAPRASPRSGRSSRVDRKRYVYYPRTSVVSNKIAARVLNRPHSITATVKIGERRRGRARRAGRLGGRLLALPQGPHAALRLQLPRRAAVPRRDQDARSPPGRHELRFEFEPTGQARPRARQGHAGARAALRRRQAGRRRASCRSPSRSTSASPRGSRAAATTARP